jgi:hypothetical protein
MKREGVVVTQQDVLVSRLSDMFEKLGLEKDKDGCVAIGRAIRSETRRLEERHSKRLGKLEEQMNQTRVDLAEAEGRMENIKTGMEGEARLFCEMLSRLGEKVEQIEKNTSKEQNVRRAWTIALMAALPGLVSVILRVIEMAAN